MKIEITVNINDIETTRRYELGDDEAYNADWTDKVQSLIEDLQDYINDQHNDKGIKE